MTESYYAQLECGDLAQAAGWRDEIDQGLRYAVALDWMPEEVSSVLDLGCGAGTFGTALQERRGGLRYVGIDRRESIVQRGREETGFPLVCGDLHTEVSTSADYVVAIGALVGGTAWTNDVTRVEDVKRLLCRAYALSKHRACIILLKEEALNERPALRLETCLGGAYLDELTSLLADITPWHQLVVDELLHEHVVILDRHPDMHPNRTTRADRIRSLWHAHCPPADRAVGVAIEGCAFELATQKLVDAGAGDWQRVTRARLQWAENFLRSYS